MSDQAYQSSLRLVPVHDLEQSALTSFRGARYHLDALRSFLRRPGVQTLWQEGPNLSSTERGLLQDQLNAFHWHLRAFFWEIVSAFDAMLHWSNRRFELSVKERDVGWDTIEKGNAQVDAGTWAKKRSILRTTWESEWFFEVRQYRNFAHRSFLLLQVSYGPSKDDPSGVYHLTFINLLPARVGQQVCRDLIEHLSEYHDRMGKVGAEMFHT